MAKLSARGRTELARLEKEGLPSDLCSMRRTTIALMSDRSILEKIDVVFRSDGRRHSYGWKLAGKVKEGTETERVVSFYAERGFVKVS